MSIPKWALRKAGPDDWTEAIKAIETLKAKTELTDKSSLKPWMKSKGWKTSWLFPVLSFSKNLIKSRENYRLAVEENMSRYMDSQIDLSHTRKRDCQN